MGRLRLGIAAGVAAIALTIAGCQPERPEDAEYPAAAPQTTDAVAPAAVPPTPDDTASAPPSGLGGARPPGS